MRWTAVLILMLASLAGCLSDGDDGTDGDGPGDDTTPDPVTEPGWAVDALYAGTDPDDTDHVVDHDHTDRALHQGLTSANIRILGHDPMVTDHHGAPAGGYYCGEVSEGEQKMAVVNSFTSQVALALVDVTDPTAPTFLGELALPRTQIYDSAITKDGQYVVLATSPLEAIVHEDSDGPVLSPTGPTQDAGQQASMAASAHDDQGTPDAAWAPVFTDRCGQTHTGSVAEHLRTAQGPLDEAPYDSGVLLVDVSDPTEPVVADFVPQPALGPHSVFSTTIDDTRWVIASTTNLAYQGSFFSFFTVDDTPLGGKLVLYGQHSAHYDYGGDPNAQPTDPGSALNLLNGHVDASMQRHPESGELVAYLANWDAGLIILRLDGPGLFTELATWGAVDSGQGQGMTGAIHTAHPLPEPIDGRHITITGQELGGRPADRPTGQIVFLDTTDPATPTPVARWTLPVDVAGWGGLLFSTHYVAYQDGILWTALYHGGVWAADADPTQWPELPSLGVLVPAEDPPQEAATSAIAPEVLDVLALGNGTLLSFDSTTGAYTYTLDRSVDLPPAAPWTADAWIGTS